MNPLEPEQSDSIGSMAIFKSTVLFILFLITVVGNSLIVHVGRKHWQHVRRTTTRILIINLALSDLLVGVCAMPFEFAEEVTGQWLIGPVMCKIIEFIQTTGFGVNVITVVFIALDRYLILAKPVTWRSQVRVAKYMIGFAWAFPVILSSPNFVIYDIVDISSANSSTHGICSTIPLPYRWLDKLYWGLEIYYVYLLPFVIIAFCYSGILREVKKMKRVGEPSGCEDPKACRWHKIKVNTSRLALVVITMFLVCWVPSLVVLCLRVAHGSRSVHRASVAYELALFMAYVNEAINPVLYGYFDSFFNRMLRLIIKKRFGLCPCNCCTEPDVLGSYSTGDPQKSL